MNSKELFARAQRVMPGGVNSPVRAFNAVGGDPVYMVSGSGSRMRTADGNELIDFCNSWGPLILGHARAEVVAAIQTAAGEGTSFGTNTPREVDLAELLCETVPYLDQVRLVNSGTEAVMTALRLARGHTGRQRILKFEGCYHGHADYLLVSAGSGLLTGGVTSSAGVSAATAAEILVSPYNDLSAVEAIVQEHGDDLAAIIVEPVAANMGLVPPQPGFLEGLRKLVTRCGALLIFDEVITGFRLGPTTYGNLCAVTPDLTTLGKIIGGGMPIGALGGRTEIMAGLAPLGPVYQAGTLSGNPVAVAAGLATLRLLQEEAPYLRMERLGALLEKGLTDAGRQAGVPLICSRLGSMFTPFFSKQRPRDLAGSKQCDTAMHAAFFRGMLERGIYLPPSQFEVAFLSAAHTSEDIEGFIKAASAALAAMGRG